MPPAPKNFKWKDCSYDMGLMSDASLEALLHTSALKLGIIFGCNLHITCLSMMQSLPYLPMHNIVVNNALLYILKVHVNEMYP